MDKYKQYEKPINTIYSYKSMLTGKKEKLSKSPSLDLDTYITEKAIDGIFFEIAQEEKKIRQNPVAKTTKLLRKVFGNL